MEVLFISIHHIALYPLIRKTRSVKLFVHYGNFTKKFQNPGTKSPPHSSIYMSMF